MLISLRLSEKDLSVCKKYRLPRRIYYEFGIADLIYYNINVMVNNFCFLIIKENKKIIWKMIIVKVLKEMNLFIKLVKLYNNLFLDRL